MQADGGCPNRRPVPSSKGKHPLEWLGGAFLRPGQSSPVQDSSAQASVAGMGNAKRAVPCEAQPFFLSMVSRARLELARRRHCHLKTACLPIPPPRREKCFYSKSASMASAFFALEPHLQAESCWRYASGDASLGEMQGFFCLAACPLGRMPLCRTAGKPA